MPLSLSIYIYIISHISKSAIEGPPYALADSLHIDVYKLLASLEASEPLRRMYSLGDDEWVAVKTMFGAFVDDSPDPVFVVKCYHGRR